MSRCNSGGIFQGDHPVNTGLKSAFNEAISSTLVSFVEGVATYNLIPSNFRTFTSLSGAAVAQNRLFKVSTGTTSLGFGAIQSFRAVSHKAGRGIIGRFSGYFESNVTNSEQGIGLISIGDELSFGYNGIAFGIWHRYGGLPEVRTITVTLAASGAQNLTLILNSVTYTIPLTAGTTAHNAYEIAAWLNANQSVWGADELGSTVIISALSDGAKSGTYSYSSSVSTGTITQNIAGVTKTSEFIPQSEWNGENADFLKPETGNIYQVAYQDMGYGNVTFSLISAKTGKFIDVHNLNTANTSTLPSVSNPSLRIGMYAASIGSTTNLNVHSSAMAIFIDGDLSKTRNPRAYSFTQSLTTTNFTNLITLRNRRTYNYYNNQVEIAPVYLSISNETNKSVTIDIRSVSSSTIGVEQNFTAAGTNLVSDIDTTAITISSGTLLSSFTIASLASQSIDLRSFEIRIPPSLALVIQGKRNGGATGDVTATITWYEDL